MYRPMLDDSVETTNNDIQLMQNILEEENIRRKWKWRICIICSPFRESGVLIAKASDYNRFAALIGEKELHQENEAYCD